MNAQWLVESPDFSEPLDAWEAFRKRLEEFPGDDEGIVDSKDYADRVIALKKAEADAGEEAA